MTFDLLQLGFGAFILSACITYALWAKVRIVFLREDLFLIRDKLWDKACELDAFDDPSYREMRSRINSCIEIAPSVSVPSLIFTSFASDNTNEEIEKSSNQELNDAIEAAEKKTLLRIFRYLVIDRPFSGLFCILVLGTTLSLHALIKKWLEANGPKWALDAERHMRISA